MSNKPNANPAQPAPDLSPDTDLYAELLQIPPGPRPPHLYQLLGIELFCPHPEEIERAVRAQFRKIKPYEEHPDIKVRERIQDVMSHIATARTVLRDPEQKQRYDEVLATRLKVNRDEMLLSRPAARIPEFALTVIAGPARVGARWSLVPDRRFTIGSDPHCVLPLPSSRLRGVHAQLECAGSDWMLRNADPGFVTLVNDERRREFLLKEGDHIDLGGYRLHFERIGAGQPDPKSLPAPLSLVIREGPSIPEPVMNAVGPASILIGNCETALWQLLDPRLSLHHARVSASGAVWQIEDLKSTTGTFVNGERITRELLHHRDQISIGHFQIQVRLRR